ncbi:hypothetical protein GQ43DRAFT_492783 [Delitschia confertaspora ATCC 74209]|uniref:FHA domain-containing protein n=1 Tax=Delitschia confertaspora ATCC 74209 TaxID=1513339 RepID=A0A9P4MMY8_9PLEO|nr:hypothetical protein GQ43DRAFT_492783 [Delitschia confertaspora ATCC 74209]
MPPADATLQVTLSILGGQDEFKKRKIILAPNDQIPIGRASKSTHKNVQSAANNIYIDSAVISREHAVLSNKTSSGVPTIYLKDVGSMHGTMVNEKIIKAHRDIELNNGDILQFGSDVLRESNRFFAKKFHFESGPILPPPTPTSVKPAHPSAFTVPDAETSEGEVSSEEMDTMRFAPHAVALYGTQSNPVDLDDLEDVLPRSPVVSALVSESETKISIAQPDGPLHAAAGKDRYEEFPNMSPLGRHVSSDEDEGDFDEDEQDDEEAPLDHNSDGVSSRELSPPRPLASDFEDPLDGAAVVIHQSNSPQEPPSAKVSESTEIRTSLRGMLCETDNEDDDADYLEDGYSVASDDISSEQSYSDEEEDREAVRPAVISEHVASTITGEKGSGNPSMSPWVTATSTASGQAAQSAAPYRANEMPMSLKNIMSSDEDLISPLNSRLDVPAPKSSERTTPPSQPLLATPTCKESHNRPLGMSEYPHFGPWGGAAGSHRTTPPRPTPWGTAGEFSSLMKEIDDSCEDYPFQGYMPYQDGGYRVPSDSYTTFGRPIGGAVNTAGPLKSYVPPSWSAGNTVYGENTWCPRQMPSGQTVPRGQVCSAFDQPKPEPIVKNATTGRTDEAWPRMPTPPTSNAALAFNNSMDAIDEPLKPRTRVSITEIVEEPPQIFEVFPREPPTPTSVTSMKRKAEVLDVEEPLEMSTSAPIGTETGSSKTETAPAAEPRAKRMRLQLAATAMAGAVVGGLGVLGALISLPDNFFQ